VVTIGSLFSGVGGLDLAVEAVTGGRTVWQVEREPAARRVLARHWPDADRSCVDVREARGMPPVDVVCGGFPCQDLSVAGSRRGLSGERSGLFFELARVVVELQPSLVVLENVPGVAQYRDTIEEALPGYGCRWVRWSATTAGAPHLRRRVLVVATRGGPSLPDVDLTVTAKGRDDRLWPTPTVCGDDNVAGLSPTSGDGLATAARGALWPTPAATDYKTAAPGQRRGQLGEAVAAPGHRLRPEWVEALMGWPMGWTHADGPSLRHEADALLSSPRWPRGRPPADHAGPWPGYEWEPPRTETGPPVPGRPARLRGCGNGVVPQAAALALRAALDVPTQHLLPLPECVLSATARIAAHSGG
jgi:DNA (cytosine-5)-methyltransferase 1